MERWKRLLRRTQRIFGGWGRALRRWFLAASAVLFLLVIGALLFSPVIEVRQVRVIRGDARLNVEEVQQILAPVFGRRLFFLPTQEVTTLLREGILDVAEVTVRKDYPSTLIVQVTLDPLVARLVIADPAVSGEAEAQAQSGATVHDFLTEEGIYVQYPMMDASTIPLEIQIVDWGVRPQPGALLVSREFLDRMRAAEAALVSHFGHEVRSRTVFLRAREFHLGTEKFAVWLDLGSPLEEQLQRYRTFLRTVGPAEVRQYVDLRLSDRVIYR